MEGTDEVLVSAQLLLDDQEADHTQAEGILYFEEGTIDKAIASELDD